MRSVKSLAPFGGSSTRVEVDAFANGFGQAVAYEPLHHKYRPQVFADLVGQDAIATTLTNAIESERIAPAYLFTGPRGTGKTSSARILAKSLNCLNSQQPTPSPCGTCSVCQEVTLGSSLDVIEIDAASNTGVDNIRDLIERAQFAPVQCRFKIYCLDEVHMLSTAAFNALLKTLEEPPDRVVFILATTDPQRVLPTIISRCQRFDFRRIALDPMIQHLTYIAEQESIAITSTAVELIAQVAQGGLRDAESLLDQLSLLAGEIDNSQVWDLVGSVPEQALLALLQAIIAQQPALMVERTHALLDRGREPLTVLQNLAGFYRDLLIAKTAPDRRDLVAITAPTWTELCQVAQQFEVEAILANQQHLRSCEGQIKNSTQPRLWLEVSLLGLLPRKALPEESQPVQRPQIEIGTAPAIASSPVPIAAPVSTPNPLPVPSLPEPAIATTPVSTAETVSAPHPPSVSGETESAIANSLLPAPLPTPDPPPSVIPSTPAAAVPPAPATSYPDIEFDTLQELESAIPTVDEEKEAEESRSALDNIAPEPPSNRSESSKLSITPSVREQPGPTPIPQPPSQKPTEAAPQRDLTDTWQQVLQNLNLPSRALLKEHGQLLYWQGREVRVGIRKTLLRLAQGKVTELEETFEKCFNLKVKVTLKVLTEEQIRTQPQVSVSFKSNAPVTSPKPPSTPPPHNRESPVVAPSREVTEAPSATEPPSWQTTTEDDMTSAARSFAQFFNGAFVDPEPKAVETKETSAPLEKDS